MICLRLVWRVSMIPKSKVTLFATSGNDSTSHLSQGAPLWNHGNYLLATLKPCNILLQRGIVAYQIEPPSSFHPSWCVFCVSAQEMFQCLTPWVDPGLFDLRADRPFYIFSFPLVVMLVGVLGTRHWDKDGDWMNVLMNCNLDREDCVSCVPPFMLPSAWISGRDSCLVGVSCHIPSSDNA